MFFENGNSWRGSGVKWVREYSVLPTLTNLSDQTSAESVVKVVSEMYEHVVDREFIKINAHPVETKRRGCQNFCVVVSRTDDKKPQDLLTSDWARTKGIHSKDWTGALPRTERTPVTFN